MATQSDHTALLDKAPNLSQPPKRYSVLLHNDDYTTMEFVIEVLETFFAMNLEHATGVMLKVHHEGRAGCGIYPKDIAASKVAQVTAFATQHGHPLRCTQEEI
jgi:ATP-dependent Clp protease adaptor protein ClpS